MQRPDAPDPAVPASRSAPPADRPQLLQGVVESVGFHSPESGYSVLRIAPEQGYDDPQAFLPADRRTAVGVMSQPGPGVRLRLTGHWKDHPRHGRQFEFELAEVLPPRDRAGLLRYLCSKSFPGIGPVRAERIVEVLGPNALEVIRDHPERLEQVRGLRAAERRVLIERVSEEFAQHGLFSFLYGAGLGPSHAAAVREALGPRALELVQRDPYALARRVPGIGFQTADKIASGLGLAEDGVERCRGALAHALSSAADDGHSLVPEDELYQAARQLLRAEVPEERWREALEGLAAADEVTLEEDPEGGPEAPRHVYLPWLAASERRLAENLAALGEREVKPLATPEQLRAAEARARIELHPEQRAAVLGLCSSPVALLTGGPGVGKTTIVRLVADLAGASGARVVLASPTGRAAKRLAEATGRDAATIHRLLGWDPFRKRFVHDHQAPLQADLVVLDEVSMLDVVLANHLIRAVAPPTRLVLVGDPDQLPSVGPGNVLGDLLACGRLPTYRLTRIYRQAAGSGIVENAHRILRGQLPEFPDRGVTDGDFYLFPCEEPAVAAERVVEVVAHRIPERFDLDWMRDVQVIAPMYRGECGVDALNVRLREALGAGGREVRRGARVWRTGDRVLHTRNDYERDVFNGDMGRIVDVRADGSLTVRFPERDLAYTKDQIGDLQPAFAITVHRSQGGEYPAVVMPLLTQHWVMLQRNLLYTAITRARRLVVLVGSRRALQRAVDNDRPSLRRSGLRQRLEALLDDDESA